MSECRYQNQLILTSKYQPDALVGVQILRGVAAIAVLARHLLQESLVFKLDTYAPDWLIVAGGSGVDLFFVISGFIMLYTCMDRFGSPQSAADFMARRLIRILPLYWLCTAAILAVALTGLLYKSKVVSIGSLLSSFSFLPLEQVLHGVGWTLQYEMYFYVLFAFCLVFSTAALTIIFLPLVLCAAIALSFLLPAGRPQFFFSNTVALEFAFGLWLAYAFARGLLPKIPPLGAAALGLGAIVLSSELFRGNTTGGVDPNIRFLIWGLPSVLLVYSVLHITHISGLIGRCLYQLGNASYSIYLTHAIVMTSYAKLIKTDNIVSLLSPITWIALAICVSLLVGLLTHQFIERPIDEWLKRRWKASNYSYAPIMG